MPCRHAVRDALIEGSGSTVVEEKEEETRRHDGEEAPDYTYPEGISLVGLHTFRFGGGARVGSDGMRGRRGVNGSAAGGP